MREDARQNLAKEVSDFYESEGAVFSSKRTWPWNLMSLLGGGLKAGDLVVDIGAGNGRLADTLPKDVRYLGVEPSSTLREEAMKRGGGEDRKVIQGSFPKLDLQDGVADAVSCIAVLHHVPSKQWREESVAEMHRILKPGGWLVCTVWNLRAWRFLSWKNFLNLGKRLSPVPEGDPGDRYYSWKASGTVQQRYVHVFSFKEFKSLFNDEDWEVSKIGGHDKGRWMPWYRSRNMVVLARKK